MTTYGVVAIVKNEADRIGACLESAALAGATVATVLDTGSTDDTLARIRAVDGLEVRIAERPFVNFGVTRSEAFALARGSADWLLALDADMTVEIDEDWEPDPEADAYMIAMHTEGLDYRLPLLLRGDLPWVSIGAVHEYTALETGGVGRQVPSDAVRVSYVHDPGSPEKARFYARLLEDDLAAQPDNPRTIYYLAQAYRGLGDPRAKGLYERRAGMDCGEEAALAAYWAACLESDWPSQALALMAAWEMRPQRLEPLYDLVHGLNERGRHLSAYRLASTIVGPCDDVLPRWPGVYDWGMDFERSIAAWHVGEWGEAAALNASLLANHRLPDSVRAAVQRNAALLPAFDPVELLSDRQGPGGEHVAARVLGLERILAGRPEVDRGHQVDHDVQLAREGRRGDRQLAASKSEIERNGHVARRPAQVGHDRDLLADREARASVRQVEGRHVVGGAEPDRPGRRNVLGRDIASPAARHQSCHGQGAE